MSYYGNFPLGENMNTYNTDSNLDNITNLTSTVLIIEVHQ